MRQSRAPTASQLQSMSPLQSLMRLRIANTIVDPPPPTSSTKSGRLFGKGGLGELTPLNLFFLIVYLNVLLSFNNSA